MYRLACTQLNTAETASVPGFFMLCISFLIPWCPGGVVAIHQATLNLRTKWFVVASPRPGGESVKTVSEHDSLRSARNAFDSYGAPR
jgi:hypothetical protein